jgi:hypothetical protein
MKPQPFPIEDLVRRNAQVVTDQSLERSRLPVTDLVRYHEAVSVFIDHAGLRVLFR